VLTVLALLLKFAVYVGALFAIGIITHVLVGIKRDLKGLGLALGVVFVSASAKLLIANAELNGSLNQVFSFENWEWVWRAGKSQYILFTASVGLGFIAFRLKTVVSRSFGLCLSALCLALAFGVTGHTQSISEAPFLFLWLIPHLCIGGFWLYAPVSLWPNLNLTAEDIARQTRRFSRVAIWAVPALLISGLYLLWRLLPQVSDLWTTLYGQLLFAKFGIALLLLGLGALNKLHVTGLLETEPHIGRNHLRKTLMAEALLFALVLILVLLATTITGPAGHHH